MSETRSAVAATTCAPSMPLRLLTFPRVRLGRCSFHDLVFVRGRFARRHEARRHRSRIERSQVSDLVADIARLQVEKLTAARIATLEALGDAPRTTKIPKLRLPRFANLRH